MRFISVPRRAKYVVRPTTRSVDALGMPQVHKGLMARFMNHVFDSETSQREHGWTDDERKAVENHLLTHKDFGAHNGYYLDQIVEGKPGGPVGERMEIMAGPQTTRCTVFFRNEAGEPEQCGREATAGETCQMHANQIAEEAARNAPPPEPDVEIAGLEDEAVPPAPVGVGGE